MKLRDAHAGVAKGRVLCLLGRYDEALSSCEKALEINPEDAATWCNKGDNFYRLRRWDEAIVCFGRVLRMAATDALYASAWNGKGACAASLRHYDEAIHCFAKALEMNPDYPPTWYNKAMAEEALGLRQEATRSYRRFLDVASSQDADQVQRVRQRLRELE